MGPDGDRNYFVDDPAVAYNPRTNQYLVVWEGEDDRGGLVDGEVEIFGQLLDGAGNEIGPNDFRLSDAGPDGVTTFTARDPAVIYNSRDNQFLVVWRADGTGNLVDNEFEIFGQLLDAAGNEIGPNDFRISQMGPAGDSLYDAFDPILAYNDQRNEYLVVWEGDDHLGGLVEGEDEIFAQRLAAGGQLQGERIRVSHFGPTANPDFDAQDPAVVYNRTTDQYLIVWEGQQTIPGSGEDFQEIYGQFLAGSSGQEIGDDFGISTMGESLTDEFNANDAVVGYDPRTNSYLVVWNGEDDNGILHEDENEIFGQQLQSDGQLAGEMVRLSDMGPDGDDYFEAEYVAIALNPEAGIFLAVWESYDDNAFVTPDDTEIYGQLVRLGGGPGPGPDGKFTLYLPMIMK